MIIYKKFVIFAVRNRPPYIMENIESIDHSAIVENIDEKSSTVTVRILPDGKECGGCPAARLCGISEKEGEELKITDPRAGRFSKGERVIVSGREALHRKAIMIATVIPCLLLLISMVGVYLLTGNQTLSVLCGLGLTVIFYLLLYLVRNRIAHEFNFTLRKIKD